MSQIRLPQCVASCRVRVMNLWRADMDWTAEDLFLGKGVQLDGLCEPADPGSVPQMDATDC